MLIVIQIAVSTAICAAFYLYGTGWFVGIEDDTVSERLGYLAPWLLIPALAVLACTAITASYRMFSADTIRGTPTPDNRFLDINLRVTKNTLEQSFMAVIAWIGLAFALPPGRMTLIPVLACLFGIGRVLFWAGYQFSPAARALGFSLTSLPTIIALLWLTWTWL